jgi:hypothetical protein
VSAQHLRPLFAFVVVAIVGSVVFTNALRAQDVVDAIRNGASDVIAGTPLLHDQPYVVEEGERLATADAPLPEVDTSTGVDSTPVGGGVDGTTPAPTAGGAPASTPATSGPGTRPSGQGAQNEDRGTAPGKAAEDSPAAPKAPTTSKGHGPGVAQGPAAGGTGGPAAGHDSSGHGNGLHKAKGHDVRPARATGGHHDHGKGDDKARHGQAKGHDKSGHGHDKAGQGKAKGHAKSKARGAR